MLGPYHPIDTKPITLIDGVTIKNTIQALAAAAQHQVRIEIVTSNYGGGSSSYRCLVDSDYVYQQLSAALQQLYPKDYPTASAALTYIKKQVSLCTVSYSYQDKDVASSPSHDKFWMVDDRVFYIGSHNLYPSVLQQFSLIFQDQPGTDRVAQQLITEFWEPLWDNAIPAKKP